jgi:hypothetical protein
MVNRLGRIVVASSLAVLAGLQQPASAADLKPVYKAPPPAPVVVNPWRIDITPYGWMPSLNGSSTIKGRTVDVDASFFGDLIHRKIPSELFGLMTSFEARNDRFAIIGDFTYLLLGTSKNGSRSVTLADNINLLNVNLSADAALEATVKMTILELAGAYELVRWGGPFGSSGSSSSLDIYGGGRLWWQQAEFSLSAAAALRIQLPNQAFEFTKDRAIAKSGDVSWIDPIVGLRLRHQFTPGSELTLSGDIGGFGVGSQFSWQALGAYRWTFAKTMNVTWSGILGYRALYADYSKGAGDTLYAYDMLQHGPIVGVSARF